MDRAEVCFLFCFVFVAHRENVRCTNSVHWRDTQNYHNRKKEDSEIGTNSQLQGSEVRQARLERYICRI